MIVSSGMTILIMVLGYLMGRQERDDKEEEKKKVDREEVI